MNDFKCGCGSTEAIEMHRLKEGKLNVTSIMWSIMNPAYDERVILRACKKCGLVIATEMKISESDAPIEYKLAVNELKGGE